jgi:hypothetical protein
MTRIEPILECLIFDIRMAYNPVLNHTLQFRQEALVGFFYERNN